MALKDTIKKMHALLEELTADLNKAETGNKAAAQRVRTGSITFAKLAKVYRKESVVMEKKLKSSESKTMDKKSKKDAKKAAPSKKESASKKDAAKSAKKAGR